MCGVVHPLFDSDYSEEVEKKRYPARTNRKIKTMYRIYCKLPEGFINIKKNLDLSPTTVSKRLSEMENMGIIIKKQKQSKETLRPWYIYDKNPWFKNFKENWGRFGLEKISNEFKFWIKVSILMKTKFLVKKRGINSKEKVSSVLKNFIEVMSEEHKKSMLEELNPPEKLLADLKKSLKL
jgi:predicted transcriptional regulator